MENRHASIGLFVIGGLLLFGIEMFVIGDRHQVFARHTEYYSEFMNLAGTVKKKPASWKDLFFPTAYGLAGN